MTRKSNAKAAWGRSRRNSLYAAMIAVVAFLTAGNAAQAQERAEAQAVTLRPLSIVNLSDLEFGTLIAGTSAGSVTVNPNNDNRTYTGGLTGGANDGAAARFLTYGGPRQFIFVTRGPFPILTREGGSETMRVDRLTLNGSTFRFLDEEGLLDLRVGGRLRVNANQAPGRYSGTFEITVTYF
ncbi:DUF4402 domain-containing protein [Alterisphingorhabdus coralli]|uniref:DUF4402 domain-containing protein n=1 Tax=Alterisphingorhabdus coralli TaxID=3071408 RepID=A0AA97F7Y3_9SPHN|nr:DUF4402 domain-containing protein [Parasphingorhabdus sp. SCSIO 66989]WOE75141.1 DUF4402 domain-containing protein [Parasphingorhabdus sp. SCSIO 66989]